MTSKGKRFFNKKMALSTYTDANAHNCSYDYESLAALNIKTNS